MRPDTLREMAALLEAQAAEQANALRAMADKLSEAIPRHDAADLEDMDADIAHPPVTDLVEVGVAAARLNLRADTIRAWARRSGGCLGERRGGRWLVSLSRLRDHIRSSTLETP